METEQTKKLKQFYHLIAPHIVGHNTAASLFFDAIKEIESTPSACSAPSSIGEDEIQTEANKYGGSNYSKNHNPARYDSRVNGFISGVKWASARLSERKIVLPSEKHGGHTATELDFWVEEGWNACIDSIKRLNGIN